MSELAVLLIVFILLSVNVVLIVMFAHLCSNVRAIREASEQTARALRPNPYPPQPPLPNPGGPHHWR